MGEHQSIKVSIANRNYPLRITTEEHDRVMQAAENINKRIKDFEDNYAVKDKQDLLAMCALQFASESLNHQNKEGAKPSKEMEEQVQLLTLMIDEYLEQETNSQ